MHTLFMIAFSHYGPTSLGYGEFISLSFTKGDGYGILLISHGVCELTWIDEV